MMCFKAKMVEITEFGSSPKWKNKPNVDASFSSDKEVVLSTKIFGNKAGELNDNRL